MKRNIAALLVILLLILSACGPKPEPTRRELAQTETGWDTAHMDKAKQYTPPEGITAIRGEQTGRRVSVSLRNDGDTDWLYGEDWGQMQVLIHDTWYVIPSDEGEGAAALPTIGYILKPSETIDASFVPGSFPPGQYRRIWNGVALHFEILP